ncbi:histone-lysine N-methyltransferase, H3 lysine-79 specific [Cryptococcus neoformans Ze90-1]|nr:histone-lysine N-methyltransferase, H3 lysine-79 specific [Cryptococcus neoformans var. grubii Ze90-1]
MFSFFGDESKLPASTVMVSRITVKKQAPARQQSSGSIPGPSKSSNVTPKHSHGSLKGTPKSTSAKGIPNQGPSSSSKSTPKVKQEERIKPSATPRTPASSSSPGRLKRKTPKVQVIESESSSGSESSDDTLDPKPKRPKVTRKETGIDMTPLPGEEVVGRKVFCWDKVDMRGEWGRGWAGFVGCDEVVKGNVQGWANGGGGDGSRNLGKYRAFFPQEGFDRDGDFLPSVEVLYPAKGCRENFVLMVPSSDREFNPIGELRNTLRLILEHYIPPSHRHIFGTLAESLDISNPLSSLPSRMATPLPNSLVTPPPDRASPSPVIAFENSAASTPAPSTERQETIADLIRKSLAPNRRDGPLFVTAIERYNAAMQAIQEDGTLQQWLDEGMNGGKGIKVREWAALVDFVHDQAYSRVVGGYSHELEHHPKHPEEVSKAISGKEDAYGELRHAFMSKIIEQTKLGPDSVFVDLGSGVGNCVLQASLQAGSRSYGFELLPVPAHCARLQVREVQRRWAMWALQGNLDVEVHEGDFRVHKEVGRRLREADVVLVNNEVFPSSLNMDLADMFLDLKEGAKIVSLKPFVPEGFRMNESNCDSFAAILRSTQHDYYRDWVSWKGEWGNYYVAVIDRSRRIKFEENMTGRASRRR